MKHKKPYISKNKRLGLTASTNSTETPQVSTSKGIPTQISASSRVSVKLGESYFTFEYTETRSIPTQLSEKDMEQERASLWDLCNEQVDTQVTLATEYMNKLK